MPPPALYSVRTGTRDEIGGHAIAIVNFHERPERPGVPTALMILDDGEHIVAAGDVIALASERYRIEAIRPHPTGAYDVILGKVSPPAPSPSSDAPGAGPAAIPAADPHAFAAALRARSPEILALLAGDGPVPAIARWSRQGRDTHVTEWTGEVIGPSTTTIRTAVFSGAPAGIEARIAVEDIRHAPDTLHCRELSGFWKCGGSRLHIFGRSAGDALMDAVFMSPERPDARDLIRAIAGSCPTA